MSAEPLHGQVIEETEGMRAERAPTPIEQERQRRAERARAEAAERWEHGVREHGLLPLMQVVEERSSSRRFCPSSSVGASYSRA